MTASAMATTPGAPPGSAKRDGKLEGIRGYLAVGVVFYHVAFVAGMVMFVGEGGGFWTRVIDGLAVCLPPFFVLSGFFIYRPFARAVLAETPRPAVGSFLWQRFLRLMPAYVLVVLAALLTINYYAIDGFWYVVRPFLLLHFYWPDAYPMTGIEQTWTIPTELLYYALLPAFTVLAAKFSRSARDITSRARRMIVPLGLFVLVGFAWTVYTNLPAAQETAVSHNLWYWPFGYFDAFAVGMVLATISAWSQVTGRTPRLYRFVRRYPNIWWYGAAIVFALNVPRLFGELGLGDYAAMRQELSIHLLVLIFSGLLILPLTVPGVRSRLMETTLNNPLMRFLGRISYGIYLWHLVAMELALKQGNLFGNIPTPSPELRGTVGLWELFIPTILLTVTLATLSYYLVERPITRWAKRRKAASASPVAGPSPQPVPAGAGSVRR